MTYHTASAIEDEIRELLSANGLLPLGWFEIDDQPALLIGNVGSSQWQAFSGSTQSTDGEADPMNRWTVSSISNTFRPRWTRLRFVHFTSLIQGLESEEDRPADRLPALDGHDRQGGRPDVACCW